MTLLIQPNAFLLHLTLIIPLSLIHLNPIQFLLPYPILPNITKHICSQPHPDLSPTTCFFSHAMHISLYTQASLPILPHPSPSMPKTCYYILFFPTLPYEHGPSRYPNPRPQLALVHTIPSKFFQKLLPTSTPYQSITFTTKPHTHNVCPAEPSPIQLRIPASISSIPNANQTHSSFIPVDSLTIILQQLLLHTNSNLSHHPFFFPYSIRESR